jgi:hypothetical protein
MKEIIRRQMALPMRTGERGDLLFTKKTPAAGKGEGRGGTRTCQDHGNETICFAGHFLDWWTGERSGADRPPPTRSVSALQSCNIEKGIDFFRK